MQSRSQWSRIFGMFSRQAVVLLYNARLPFWQSDATAGSNGDPAGAVFSPHIVSAFATRTNAEKSVSPQAASLTVPCHPGTFSRTTLPPGRPP